MKGEHNVSSATTAHPSSVDAIISESVISFFESDSDCDCSCVKSIFGSFDRGSIKRGRKKKTKKNRWFDRLQSSKYDEKKTYKKRTSGQSGEDTGLQLQILPAPVIVPNQKDRDSTVKGQNDAREPGIIHAIPRLQSPVTFVSSPEHQHRSQAANPHDAMPYRRRT